jgi:hypothetical protein
MAHPLLWIPPNWLGAVAVTERLEWLTDILRASRTGATQHRALRAAPRRFFAWSSLIENVRRQATTLIAARRQAFEWAVPIWPDVQTLATAHPAGATTLACRTSGFDFAAGGGAALVGEDGANEQVTIQNVGVGALALAAQTTRAWPSGTRLYPVWAGRLDGVKDESLHSDCVSRRDFSVMLTEASDQPAAWPTSMTYRDWPVLEWRPDESTDPAGQDARDLATVDNLTAPAWIFDMIGRSLRAQKATWLIHGRAEQAAFRAMLYALAGRANPAWVPTWSADFTVTSPFAATSNTLAVAATDYAAYGLEQDGWRDIRIELQTGQSVCRRIVGVAADGENELLTLDEALGVSGAEVDVRQVSFLRLCTLASDTVEIEHVTDADGVARCALSFMEVAE